MTWQTRSSDPATLAVDDYTLALGIGWTKIASEDPDTQAAARGWVKYIENHYPAHAPHSQSSRLAPCCITTHSSSVAVDGSISFRAPDKSLLYLPLEPDPRITKFFTR